MIVEQRMKRRVVRRPLLRVTYLQDVFGCVLMIEAELTDRPGFHCPEPARRRKLPLNLTLEIVDRDLNMTTAAHVDTVTVMQVVPQRLLTETIQRCLDLIKKNESVVGQNDTDRDKRLMQAAPGNHFLDDDFPDGRLALLLDKQTER
jgi:hypothetical protein